MPPIVGMRTGATGSGTLITTSGAERKGLDSPATSRTVLQYSITLSVTFAHIGVCLVVSGFG
jgi:hypothetical protein